MRARHHSIRYRRGTPDAVSTTTPDSPTDDAETDADDAAERERRVDRLLIPVGLVALVAVVFGRVVTYEWVNWDDITYIVHNPVIQSMSWENIRAVFTPGGVPGDQLYIPVHYLIDMLQLRFFGVNSQAYHTVNLLLHTANVLLSYALLRRLGVGRWPTVFACVIFAIHPLQVESVAWAFGRRDLLSTCVGLISIFLWLRYLRAPNRWFRYATVLTFAAAALIKPTIVLLPVVYVLLMIGRDRRHLVRRVIDVAPFFVIAVLVVQVNSLAASSTGDLAWQAKALRLAWLPAILDGWFARLLLLEGPRLLYLNRDLTPEQIVWPMLVPVLLLGGVGYVLLRTRNWRVVTALVAGLALVAPAAQIVFEYNRSFYTADRYVYVAILPLALALAYLVQGLPAYWRRVSTAVLAVFIVAALMRSVQRTGDWASPVTLWNAELAINPANPIAHNQLARYWWDHDKQDEGYRHMLTTVRIDPTYALGQANLAAMLNLAGDRAGAIRRFRIAVYLDPTVSEAGWNLGRMADNAGDEELALWAYDRLLARDPGHAPARVGRAKIYLRRKRPDDAMTDLRAAIAAAPTYAPAHLQQGILLHELGHDEDALEAFRLAHRFNPGSFASAYNYGHLALESQDFTTARDVLQVAVSMRPDDLDAHRDYGMALLATGATAQALPHLERVLAVAPQDRVLLANLMTAYRVLGKTDKQAEIEAALLKLDDTNDPPEIP